MNWNGGAVVSVSRKRCSSTDGPDGVICRKKEGHGGEYHLWWSSLTGERVRWKTRVVGVTGVALDYGPCKRCGKPVHDPGHTARLLYTWPHHPFEPDAAHREAVAKHFGEKP